MAVSRTGADMSLFVDTSIWYAAADKSDESNAHAKNGNIERVKKTFNIDDTLLKEAKAACGATTDTETIRLGLQILARHAAYARLRALRGTEPHARDAPRPRERALGRNDV